MPVSAARYPEPETPNRSTAPSPLRSATCTLVRPASALRVCEVNDEPLDTPTLQLDAPLVWRPIRSSFPSAVKSPTSTSDHEPAAHESQALADSPTNLVPSEHPTRHAPVAGSRTAKSLRPSPVKSPMTGLVQLDALATVAQTDSLNPLPVDSSTYQVTVLPLTAYDKRSARPSPLKSAVPTKLRDDGHVTDVPLVHDPVGVLNALPLESETFQRPALVPLVARPARSAMPSPLKSALTMLAQVTLVVQPSLLDVEF